MKKSVEKLDKFHIYLITIFCAAVFFLLLQSLGVSETKLAGKVITGAVTVLDDLRDFASIVGAPNSVTKIITSAAPTQTETRIANYLTSNYMLCGNRQGDTGEDCEIQLSTGENELQFFTRCPNCRVCGDGMLDDINPTTGLMEQCDPGAADFVPALLALNSCSNNAQCQSGANCGICPSGSVSTNVCAYGIFKDISEGSNSYPYYYADGNLNCEAAAENSFSDCIKFEQSCGTTLREILARQIGNASLSDNDVIAFLMGEVGYSQALAEGLAASRLVTIYYNESDYSSFNLQIIKFLTRAPLDAYIQQINTTRGGLISVGLNGYYVLIGNTSDFWVWSKGEVLYVLTYGSMSTLSLSQRQQGNAIITAYLNQFGSDVAAAAASAAVCGDSICNGAETVSTCSQDCPAVCGNSIVEGAEVCDPPGAGCVDAKICSDQCSCVSLVIENNIASALTPYFAFLPPTLTYFNEIVMQCPLAGQQATQQVVPSNRYEGNYFFDLTIQSSIGIVNVIEAIPASNIDLILTAEVLTAVGKSAYESYCQFSALNYPTSQQIMYENDANTLWWIWKTTSYGTPRLVSLRVSDSQLFGAVMVIGSPSKLNSLVILSTYTNNPMYLKALQSLTFLNEYLTKYPPIVQPS